MKVVLCYSGGMDSTVLLYDLLSKNYEVKAISVNYGQKHNKELLSAKEITQSLGIELQTLDLSQLSSLLKGSALTDNNIAVPHGHYEEENMKATVVPNRNMIFMSLAAAWALSLKYNAIAIAAHGGDHAIYPDCRTEFMNSLRNALQLADWDKVDLLTPFIAMSKSQICSRGNELTVPFEKTWSCYEGKDIHCGKCGTCTERKEAFELARVIDPTKYRN